LLRKKSNFFVALHPSSLRSTKSTPHSSGFATPCQFHKIGELFTLQSHKLIFKVINNDKMNPDPSSMSFGRYLKAIRIQKRIPIEAVADEIRIGLWQLSLIEAEDHDQLPDEVYVKGILRAYAKCIGVDADDIVDRYIINRSVFHQSQKEESELLNSGKKALSRLVLSLGLLTIIVVLSIYMIYGFRANQPHETKLHKPEDVVAVHAGSETGSILINMLLIFFDSWGIPQYASNIWPDNCEYVAASAPDCRMNNCGEPLPFQHHAFIPP